MVHQEPEKLMKLEEEEEAMIFSDIDLSLKIKKAVTKRSRAPVTFQEKKDYLYVPFLN